MAKDNKSIDAADETPEERAEEPKKKPKIITVKSTLKSEPDDGDKVVLFEKDSAHPGGEAYVAGDKPVQVAETAEVNRLIRDGVLVEVK